MDLESSEQSEIKSANIKVIDGKYVVDTNQSMGGGSYSQVYAAWLKGSPGLLFACKIISKKELDRKVGLY